MTDPQQPTVGYIGLGVMGGAMAANLRKAGFRLVVNDTRREAAEPLLRAGAAWADTPRELAAQVDVVFSCLPSLAAIETVALGADGVLAGARPGLALFEMSTGTTDLVRAMHEAFAAKGAHLLDAPISGGAQGARRGRLAIWVGGDLAAFNRHEKVLRAMGDQPVHVGPVGAGLVTKLVHNCMSQTTQAAMAEIFALGLKAGAEPLALWKAIRQGVAGRRRTFDWMIGEYLSAQFFPPNAATAIIHKDLKSATELGRELGMPMRMANIALAEMQDAMNLGLASDDFRRAYHLPLERAGVHLRVDPSEVAQVLSEDPAAPTDSKYGQRAP